MREISLERPTDYPQCKEECGVVSKAMEEIILKAERFAGEDCTRIDISLQCRECEEDQNSVDIVWDAKFLGTRISMIGKLEKTFRCIGRVKRK